MNRLPDEFHEDRALRDAARAVLMADIEHARRSLSKEGLTNRVTGRIGDGAKDVIEVAKVQAEDKRGIIAGLIALLALWFARQPLLEIFGLAPISEDEDVLEEAANGDAPASDNHEMESPLSLDGEDDATTSAGEADD